jgi:hypothetical protein
MLLPGATRVRLLKEAALDLGQAVLRATILEPGQRIQPDRTLALSAALVPFLHYGGADENAPLLFVVGVGVLIGLFLAWRRR